MQRTDKTTTVHKVKKHLFFECKSNNKTTSTTRKEISIALSTGHHRTDGPISEQLRTVRPFKPNALHELYATVSNKTRLTGQSINNHPISVALLDQCFPYEESKLFGIEFRLPRTGGNCDDGLIICYLGSLATRTVDNVHTMNGMSVNSELFNVDNAFNNIIKLSTSLLGLGDKERRIFEIAGDKAKLEAFTELAPKGARLKDFVGFWTLGLDMLPWMDHEVKLFVNRTCSCTMEAWKPQEQELTPWKRIPNFQQGTNVTFRVKLHSIEDDFRIFFLHNRIQSSKTGIEILNVQPKKNVIVLQSYLEGNFRDVGNITLASKHSKPKMSTICHCREC
ncbi:hypothetical protein GPALN_014349 [Globodera pallida]|nr:hypothetical protein GPALN_014349 [Globodera pallida]